MDGEGAGDGGTAHGDAPMPHPSSSAPSAPPVEGATDAATRAFEVLSEIGILQQLASAELARHLPDGLHPSHFAVLRHLVRRGDGRSLLDVARAMQTTKPNMTNTVLRLADRGLVEIRPNPADGRSKLMFLTDAGRAFVNTAADRLAPTLAEIDRRHGLERIAAMLPELRALREVLDAMRD